MSTEIRPAHSPLGASGAERWMNCPGSITLLQQLGIKEDSDAPDYQVQGTAAHSLVEQCLRDGSDAWEHMGEKMFNGIEVTQEMQLAAQVYLDYCRDQFTPNATVFIEQSIDAPDFHRNFYGTVDCAVVDGNTLYINDFKYGEGIMVDVEHNPQIMYYAYGILRHHPEVERVVLTIIQPRGYHPDGPIRDWAASATEVREWAEGVLLPAMLRTEFDHDLLAGDWCRFCPAKLVCPLMVALFGAAMTADPRVKVNLSNDSLGREYKYLAAVKHYIKAVEEELYKRLNRGEACVGTKLVWKKANRVFKSGAVEVFKKEYGDQAFTKPELKSPAEMEKVSAGAKTLVHEWAYTPQNGLTVASEDDNRPGVKVQTTEEAFAAALVNEGEIT